MPSVPVHAYTAAARDLSQQKQEEEPEVEEGDWELHEAAGERVCMGKATCTRSGNLCRSGYVGATGLLFVALLVLLKAGIPQPGLWTLQNASLAKWEYTSVKANSGDDLFDTLFNETLWECIHPVRANAVRRGQCYDAMYGKLPACKQLRLKESPPASCDRVKRCLRGEPHDLVNPCLWLCQDGNKHQADVRAKCLEAFEKATEWGAKCHKEGFKQKEFEYLEKVNEYSHQCLAHTTTTTTAARSQLFCWVLVVPWTNEVELLLLAEKLKAGFLQCDASEVFSDRKMHIGSMESIVVDVDLHCNVNKYTLTVENTPIFKKVWRKVLDTGTWKHYEWTIKVDLDAMFLPDRLRPLLNDPWVKGHAQTATGLWLNNCWRGLHGPIEVVSRRAMEVWDERWPQCDAVAYKHPQEDVYLRVCMETIGVWRHDAWSLLAEDHCDRPDYQLCAGNWIAYHPFKEVEEWQGCYNRATGL
mmetsp:Transcript_11366/g.21465  ORF Transcript_11366/g.21465 Transcript_11366/m.21465 type:complete len:472 (-) Transcript_11366:86-1501(-)